MSDQAKPATKEELNLPLSREEYSPADLNGLSYEDELKCWYHYNYKGNTEKEWSFKVFFLGSLLACLMVLINIYMGLKTGWGEGGSIIAVLLAFLVLGTLSKIGLIGKYSVLETNMIQTMASAGGSLGNLVNVVPALLLLGVPLLWYDMFSLVFLTSFLGVFFAIPLRRQNVVIEKLRFPTGTACYQTIRAVHEDSPDAKLKAMALAFSGIFTALFVFFQVFPTKIQGWLAGSKLSFVGDFFKQLKLAEHGSLVDFYQKIIPGAGLQAWLKKVDLNIAWSPMLFGIGFMTGPRVGIGMLIGGAVSYLVLPEYLLKWGCIDSISFSHIRDFVMWPATSLMVFASFVSLASKFKVILRAFRGLKQDKAKMSQPGGVLEQDKEKTNINAELAKLEVPKPVLVTCLVLVIVALLIFMSKRFGIAIHVGVFAIVFSFLLALIAVRAAGETDINPVGAMGHVTQIVYGSIFNCTYSSNLGASGVTAAGASEAGDMMQDLKTGYLIGATPKRQVYIQLCGILIGSAMAVILLNALLYYKDGKLAITDQPAIVNKEGKVIQAARKAKFPAPAAHVWKVLAEAMSKKQSSTINNKVANKPTGAPKKQNNIPKDGIKNKAIIWSIIIGGAVGLLLGLLELTPVKSVLPSTIGIGIAPIIPLSYSLSIFLGSMLQFFFIKSGKKNHELVGPIAAGTIAGEPIVGTIGQLLP